MVKNTEGDVAILSIHPMYVKAIKKGEKKVEFRKTRFTKNVKYIVVYETAPLKQVVGFFTVKAIIADTPKMLWEKYFGIGCITKPSFFKYYMNCKKGYGIEIDKYYNFINPIDINKICNMPPQSFRYIDNQLFLSIIKNNVI